MSIELTPVGSPTPTVGNGVAPTSAEMVTLIKQMLRDNPVGLFMVTSDGQTVQYSSRAEALKELTFWESRVSRESGRRPRVMRINLSGGFNT